MPTKPVILDETGQDIAAALWGLGAILRERSELSFRQMKDAIISGAGAKLFPVGTTFTTVKGNYVYPWAFMHHGKLPDGRPYADVRVIRAVNLLQGRIISILKQPGVKRWQEITSLLLRRPFRPAAGWLV